jgi:hypothetical protein
MGSITSSDGHQLHPDAVSAYPSEHIPHACETGNQGTNFAKIKHSKGES